MTGTAPATASGPTAAAVGPDTLAAAVEAANLPTLLMVVIHLTGDRRWLDDRYRPRRPRGLGDDDSGGLDAEAQAEVKAAARLALAEYLERGCPAPAMPSPDALRELLTFSVGEEVPEDYGRMMHEDLAAQLAPRTPAPAARPDAHLSALIIGAGPSGIAAAIALRSVGVPFLMVEQNTEVGGTWLDNEYPGAAVDTPSDIYSFSFAPFRWRRYFAAGDELRDYLDGIADQEDLRPAIRFGVEARTAVWDEDARTWSVTLRRRDGSTETVTANLLISAVGALSRPTIPEIPGLASFIGPSFHTARWPAGIDLAGKRVGVIGTGASAMQLVPSIVDEVGHLTVFQRSAQWAAPFEKCKVEIPEALRELTLAAPIYRAWYRQRQAWIFNDRVYDSLIKDPEWPHQDRAVNAVNDRHRQFFTDYILAEIGDRPDLVEKVLPTYPPFLKRMLLDNGWFKAMARDDVTLETGRIRKVAKDRVIMESGEEHILDVLVLSTGFDATHFLASLDVRGRGGTSLSEAWDEDDPKAYLGMTVPGFPNFFTMNGPNLLTGHGGSLMYIAECQLRYLLDIVGKMLDRRLDSIECRHEINEAYNAAVDAQHDRMIWSHKGADTYYRNHRGRVVVNSPWRVIDFWSMTREADLDDYIVR
ncbi:MAG: NAD(P)/FAD-dependent oxidoreductase [Actinobacteria bacterium]|nr:NAD(P)/FAD-dependent oxidoreductase [Actinomycetota bacterium]